MKAYYNQEKIASSLRKFFKKVLILSKPHLYLISYIITALISSESVVTSDIAREFYFFIYCYVYCTYLAYYYWGRLC